MKEQQSAIKVKMHQGHALMNLAKHYPTVPAVILEVVQNAIDAGAKKIRILVNKIKNSLVVYDNGSGASREQVTQALQSVACTMKNHSRYGQFGIGLISPLAVSGKFTFTSCPTSRNSDYVQYVFVTKDIEAAWEVDIPRTTLEHLHFDPNGKTWWRTSVEATRLTRERRPSTLNPGELAKSIALKYGAAIRVNGIDIQIELTDEDGQVSTTKVEAPEFTGTKLEIFKGNQAESGEVELRLYLARLQKGTRKGSLVFGTYDNPSRISGEQFVLCTRELLDRQVAKAIISGVFEGCIICKKVILHPDRTRFEDNDALFALCEVLELWFKKIGKEVFEDAGEQSQNDYFQQVGLSVMPFIDSLAALPQFVDMMNNIKIGTIGDGHARVPRKNIIGKEADKSLSADGGSGGTRDGASGEGTVTEPRSNNELESHTPPTVYGIRGKRRTSVRGNSTGIRLEHVEMDDFRVPFEFDLETGTLSINTNNPLFGKCQKERSHLQQYHWMVATLAFSLELRRDMAGHINPELVSFAHESLETQVFGIENSKALIG